MKFAALLLLGAVPAAVESTKAAATVLALPKVPKVQNAGTDGFPSLPEVGTMLGDFSQTLQGISSQTSSLEAQLQKVQADSQLKMKKEKAVFDKRLHGQEVENLKIQGENSALAKKIMTLHKSNDALMAKIKKTQKVNKFRKSEVMLLEKQFDRAHKAAEDALAAADDSKAPELAILSKDQKVEEKKDASPQKDEAKATEEKEPETTSATEEAKPAEEEENPAFFLETKMKRSTARAHAKAKARAHAKARRTAPEPVAEEKVQQKDADLTAEEAPAEAEEPAAAETPAVSDEDAVPESLVTALSAGLKSMRQQADKSDAKLKAFFEKAFKSGAQRHAALADQAQALKKSYAGMKKLEIDLQAAEGKLEATQNTLQQRISNMGAFLGKLEKVAVAPLDKVKPALEDANAWQDREVAVPVAAAQESTEAADDTASQVF